MSVKDVRRRTEGSGSTAGAGTSSSGGVEPKLLRRPDAFTKTLHVGFPFNLSSPLSTVSLILRLTLHAVPPTCPPTDRIHNLFHSKMKNQTYAGEY